MSNYSFLITVVGVGGTGTFVLKELSRFLEYYIPQNPNTDIHLACVDGDTVEYKNMERQCFSESDIAQNKAVCFAEAVNECFPNVGLQSFPFYLYETSDIQKIFESLNSQAEYSSEKLNILIGCCDNHRCRQVMDKFFHETKSIIYIDAANEFSKGEVVTGWRKNGKTMAPPRSHYFPGILKSREKKAGTSCGTINKSKPQHIATNMLAANVVLSRLFPLFTAHKISPGIVYFDTFAGDMVAKEAFANESEQEKVPV